MADLKTHELLLPFLEEMAKHAIWCRKHTSDAANCTCPAEGAQAEIDAIHSAVAAVESKLFRSQQRESLVGDDVAALTYARGRLVELESKLDQVALLVQQLPRGGMSAVQHAKLYDIEALLPEPPP